MRAWPAVAVPSLPGRGPALRVHDSATGAPALVDPEDLARLYVCGITPYDATHLGHAATYVTFDVLVRVWLDRGLDVRYVQNVTDVDDPLLERAARDGIAWERLAEREIDLFREDMHTLRVLPPQHYVGAVEGIPSDVRAVLALLGAGRAYSLPVAGEQSEDVYLDLAQAPGFGTVSGWTREQMLEVFADRGGDPDRAGKRDPLDPLLWRGRRPGEPSWDQPGLGPGRPGWHLECTTIALDHLVDAADGLPFDVQGGGTDLIFPHHEMSAVQAAALTDEPRFAAAYVHQAMVALDGAKMSKSQGNLVLVSRLRAEGVDPMAVRLLLLAHHHTQEWEYTDADLIRAQERLGRWRAGLPALPPAADTGGEAASPAVTALREALADGLDTPAALRVVDDALDSGVDQDRAAGLEQAVDALLGVAVRRTLIR